MALQHVGCCAPSRVARARLFEDLKNPANRLSAEQWEKNQHTYSIPRFCIPERCDKLDPNCEYTVDETTLEPYRPEIKWVVAPCDPKDGRLATPVAAQRLLTGGPPPKLHPRDRFWVRPIDPPLRSFMRPIRDVYPSHWTSRCENSSTLMDNMPSQGPYLKVKQEQWQSGPSLPPINTEREYSNRFPGVTSAMVRYVDDIHSNNRLFKIYS